ncbi:MAG TPA: hypothetical protein PLD25_26410 [Chloroflexota bacterium]|nr:hypothetical protein [Chloroflexota bacterium]
MKSTTSTVIILALIMLLLVMVAAFVFLFQGRQTLVGQRDDLATAVTGLDMTRTQLDLAFQSVEATRLATGQELATAIAEAILYEGQLVESQQQVNTLTTEMEALQAELAASSTVTATAVSPTAVSAPSVQIVSPATGTAVTIGQTIDIVFAAADPAGLATMNLTINSESFKSYDPNDATLYTVRETWTPTEPGEVEIGVLAVNVNGRASSAAPITLTVTAATQSAALNMLAGDADAALRAEIESRVSLIRGLPPQNPVVTTLLSSEELRQRVENDLLADYTEADAQKDVLVYAAFDFLSPDFDLFTFSRDLYSEQIAGFYDPETDEFVVVSDDAVLDANEQLTHAHEYMHALQDQHFNLDLLDDDSLDADASAALLGLAEGEAVLLQMHYLQEGHVDLLELLANTEAIETPVLDSAPPVLANSLLYPYTAGLAFAQTLYTQGGYAALNAAWANPPQSTEQILHPERYLAGDAPLVVTLPPLTDTLGVGWALVNEDVLGEFMLRQYLSQQLNPQQVDTAVTGWGGDRFAVYTHADSGALVLALRLVWDTDKDATEFAALYPNYPTALFSTSGQLQGNGGECWQGPADTICLFQTGRETLIIRALNEGTAVRLRNEIR